MFNKSNSLIYSKIWTNKTFNNEIDDPRNLKMIVSLYIYQRYDDKDWNKIAKAASMIDIIVIININKGPGAGEPNVNYQKGIFKLKCGGVVVLGY